jgi:hypothetical protein
MKSRHRFLVAAAVVMGTIGITANAQDAAVPPAPTNGPEDPSQPDGVEVLTRGPVHEAFAQQYESTPKPGPVVTKAPPEPINEVPPELKPEGNNVQWLPGYWSWDDERNDFLWVSGLWRDVPPDQRWVPGSWVAVDGGFQWISGFWTSLSTDEITYLPEPPPSQENGPNAPAPNDNSFWIPGQWVYVNSNYQWQPGYWAPVQQNWVWAPARYYWTPYGYVYTAGYWDYPPTARGVLFSPVYASNYFGNRGYQPQVVVPIGPMLISMFVRPGYRSYYFGNYYGNNYRSMGYYPWIAAPNYMTGGSYYDPLWMYYRFSAQPGVFNRLYGWNQFYFSNPGLRPATTFAQAQAALNAQNVSAENKIALRQALLGEQLSKVQSDPGRVGAFQKFSQLSDDQRQALAKDVKQFRQLQQARGRQERQAAFRGSPTEGTERSQNGLKLPEASSAAPAETQGKQQPHHHERGKLPQPPDVKVPAAEERLQGLPDKAPELKDETRRQMEQKRRQLDDRMKEPRQRPANEQAPATQTPEASNKAPQETPQMPDRPRRGDAVPTRPQGGANGDQAPNSPPAGRPGRSDRANPETQAPQTQPRPRGTRGQDDGTPPRVDRAPSVNPAERPQRMSPAEPRSDRGSPATIPQATPGQGSSLPAMPRERPIEQETRRPVSPMQNQGIRRGPVEHPIPQGGSVNPLPNPSGALGNPIQQETRRPVSPLQNPGNRSGSRMERPAQPSGPSALPVIGNPAGAPPRAETPRPGIEQVRPSAPQATPAPQSNPSPARRGRARGK